MSAAYGAGSFQNWNLNQGKKSERCGESKGCERLFLDTAPAIYFERRETQHTWHLSESYSSAFGTVGCEAFLTNDSMLSRGRELRVLVLFES